jgi:ABC-type branched-subunit amino acid transport system substrate-binding protein
MRVFMTATVCGAMVCSIVSAQVEPKNEPFVSKVQKKIRNLQPSRAEKRFDEIGWAPSILEAEKIAKKLNRPVYLFTYNGKIETGRC